VKVEFLGDKLVTKLVVSSTTKEWSKPYEQVMIDTGAFNTAIPQIDIAPTSTIQHLELIGIRKTGGLGFEGFLNVYEANLSVGEQDTYLKTPVLATPNMVTNEGESKPMDPVLGREIISHYMWEIDYKAKTVKATKYEGEPLKARDSLGKP
jgi:hypothetical protein